MDTRKEMKQRARQSLRSHYFIFVAACLIAAFLGTEFAGSLFIIKSYEAKEGNVSSKPGLSDVLTSLLSGNLEAGRELSEELKQNELEKSKHNKVLERRRGVAAQVVNALTSGSIYVTVLSAFHSIAATRDVVSFLLLWVCLFLFLSAWIFLINMYKVISRRIFLEGRTYEKVSIQRFLFLFRVKRWTKVSFSMLVSSILYVLWCFTVVGIFVKRYSYFMVPYILAENPDIGPLKAITLSRQVMQGHKWKCFTFELSFLGWDFLSLLTLGLTGIFYVQPYKVASFCEYYACLRLPAKKKHVKNACLLNDAFLYEKADSGVLQAAYGDVIEQLKNPFDGVEKKKGILGFLARNFGIVIFRTQELAEEEAYRTAQLKSDILKDTLEAKIYPGRLFSIPEERRWEKTDHSHYMRYYSMWSLILLFFIFSFIGWVWEGSLGLITSGILVNRGVLHGPWLPIYGAGAILILTLLKRFRHRPALELTTAIILCGCVEYFTGYYLELTHGGMKWWDYSGYFLNLHGRICAEGLLVFGLGGIAVVYVLAPLLDNVIQKIRPAILVPLCILLLVLIFADIRHSAQSPNTGAGITSAHRAYSKLNYLPPAKPVCL